MSSEAAKIVRATANQALTTLTRRTSYANRDMLARFLDAVDRRDGETAASLFTDDGVWETNTATFGTLEGRQDIVSVITGKLPPIGKESPRHCLSDGTTVIMPNGQQVHFHVELDDSTGRIKALSRIPIGERRP